jgi:polyribonucleotide nucleotidyltransferase
MRLSCAAALLLVATYQVDGFSVNSPRRGAASSLVSVGSPSQNSFVRQPTLLSSTEDDAEEVSGVAAAVEEIAAAVAAEAVDIAVEAVEAALEEVEVAAEEEETEEEVEEEEEEEEVFECDVPVGEFKIETTTDGPAGGTTHKLTVNLGAGGEPLIFETGKIGRLAAGAVTLTRGDTVLYATASRDDKPKEDIEFLPLSVEHQERFSSVGTTSGSYNKRDGRPAEHEILTCRLIDRPLRPLIAAGWRHETQLLNWVLSFDGKRSTDPLAITAASTALYISDVPLAKPVAGVNVGYVNEQFVINPTLKQMEKSSLHLTVAGTKDAVLMIEGAANFLPEAIMIAGIKAGHEVIRQLCEGIEALGAAVGKEKNYSTIIPPPEGLQERVDELFSGRIDDMYNLKTNKKASGLVMDSLYTAVVAELDEEFPNEKIAVKAAFKDLLCRRMFAKGSEHGTRCDGRGLKEIRPLTMEAGLLPRVHGSALFTRGETQTIATATLGDSGMKQKIDRVDGKEEKRFYLQYTFPPSCVGETGRVGMPGRREVGHGNLAER